MQKVKLAKSNLKKKRKTWNKSVIRYNLKSMLKIIDGLPANVLGVTAEGKITGEDYSTVLIPAIEAKLTTNKKINMLYHLGNTFDGFSLGAMLDDSEIGIKHLAAWEKIAIVSDHEMINAMVRFFGHLIPCELRIFKNAELEEAKKWIIEK